MAVVAEIVFMATVEPAPNLVLHRQPVSLLAGVLSYLVPGLGQIYQGRVAKGLLFLVCLYGLFFTGMAMGDWKNVYLPDMARVPGPDGEPNNPHDWENNVWKLPTPLTFLANIYNRPHFAGQFWIGIAAWPAIWQYNNMKVPSKEDAPFWHDFERGPRDRQDDEAMNEFLTNSDKTPDLGWVYTVIAGVLNILVIYDAFAGPAFGAGMAGPRETPPAREAVPA
jgi:hypothetical protein